MENETPVAAGDTILYAKEDAGRILGSGLYLQPGEPLTVGEDLTLELAARLVEERVCAVAAPEDTEPEDTEPEDTDRPTLTAVQAQPVAGPPPTAEKAIALGGPVVTEDSSAKTQDSSANTQDS